MTNDDLKQSTCYQSTVKELKLSLAIEMDGDKLWEEHIVSNNDELTTEDKEMHKVFDCDELCYGEYQQVGNSCR